MNSPAAFQATFSDWKLIRSRKVVQIVLEIPLEASGQAYDVLGGMPNPGAETWCAVARLNVKEATQTATPTPAPASVQASPVRARKPWREIDYPQQAGLLCQDAKFRRFLAEHDKCTGIAVYDLDTACDRVREICDVQSRTEIRAGTKAEQRWNLLVSAYRAWEMAPSVGAA